MVVVATNKIMLIDNVVKALRIIVPVIFAGALDHKDHTRDALLWQMMSCTIGLFLSERRLQHYVSSVPILQTFLSYAIYW